MSKLSQEIPSLTGLQIDPGVFRMLNALGANIRSLAGSASGGASLDQAVSWRELRDIGVIGINGNRIYSRVPVPSDASAASIGGTSDFIVYSKSVKFRGTGVGTGSYYLALSLPVSAVIIRAWYDVISPFTSGGAATIGIGIETDDVAGIVAPAGVGAPWNAGYHDTIQNGAAANFTNKTTDLRSIQLDVAGAALTGGELNLFVEYVVSI